MIISKKLSQFGYVDMRLPMETTITELVGLAGTDKAPHITKKSSHKAKQFESFEEKMVYSIQRAEKNSKIYEQLKNELKQKGARNEDEKNQYDPDGSNYEGYGGE